MKNNKKNVATKTLRHQDTPSFFYNKTLCAPSCLGAFVAFSKIAEIGQKATIIFCKGVAIPRQGFKRFKAAFCKHFLKSAYYSHSLKWAFKGLKSGLKGGYMGVKVPLKKMGGFVQNRQMSEMPKTQLCHQGTKAPRYTKIFIGG